MGDAYSSGPSVSGILKREGQATPTCICFTPSGRPCTSILTLKHYQHSTVQTEKKSLSEVEEPTVCIPHHLTTTERGFWYIHRAAKLISFLDSVPICLYLNCQVIKHNHSKPVMRNLLAVRAKSRERETFAGCCVNNTYIFFLVPHY